MLHGKQTNSPSKETQAPPVKPPKCANRHLVFLDDLRRSGVTNMFGAVPYLRANWPMMTQAEASAILSYWMKTFSDRHPKAEGEARHG